MRFCHETDKGKTAWVPKGDGMPLNRRDALNTVPDRPRGPTGNDVERYSTDGTFFYEKEALDEVDALERVVDPIATAKILDAIKVKVDTTPDGLVTADLVRNVLDDVIERLVQFRYSLPK